MGRPSKFNPATADFIVTMIESGVPRDHAARAAGVAPSTFYKWLAAGRNEEPVDPDEHTARDLRRIAAERNIDLTGRRKKADIAEAINAEQSPFVEFAERVDQATSRFMASAIGKMRETGGDDWRMWDKLLERRFPELRTTSRPDDGSVDTDELAGTPDDADRMLERGEAIEIKMLETGTDG